jgi:HD-GYP domain-containing protein (c-di-GMP phosphodiesterase class II)
LAIELLELVADQLKVGVPLAFSVLDDNGNLLLAAGKVLSGEAEREQLLARGIFAEFDEPEEDDEDAGRHFTLFERWQRSSKRLDRLLGSLGKPGFASRCQALAVDLQAQVARDPDIAIYITMRQDPAQLMRWGLTHAVHCAILAQLAASRIGWPPERVACLVRAALTMNLAIVPIQGLLAQVGKVSEGQRERIHAHPQLAHDRLRAAGVEDDDWLRAVLEHHERDGGGGYPEGLHQPSELAQALRLIDSFLTKISPRAGRAPMAVQDAARALLAQARTVPIAVGIIKEFGMAPPGQPVQLASGELGLVVRRGASAQAPLVAALTDGQGKPVLSTHLRDTAQPAYAIRRVGVDAKALQRVMPERLYGLVD